VCAAALFYYSFPMTTLMTVSGRGGDAARATSPSPSQSPSPRARRPARATSRAREHRIGRARGRRRARDVAGDASRPTVPFGSRSIFPPSRRVIVSATPARARRPPTERGAATGRAKSRSVHAPVRWRVERVVVEEERHRVGVRSSGDARDDAVRDACVDRERARAVLLFGPSRFFGKTDNAFDPS